MISLTILEQIYEHPYCHPKLLVNAWFAFPVHVQAYWWAHNNAHEEGGMDGCVKDDVRPVRMIYYQHGQC